ncbi:unnamed protein product [Urochloa humidicola]
MAPPPPPAEILLHLPPGQPEHLFHAALVCKLWLCVLYDPAFRRRYRVFHGAPPLLGRLLLACAVLLTSRASPWRPPRTDAPARAGWEKRPCAPGGCCSRRRRIRRGRCRGAEAAAPPLAVEPAG